MYDLPTTYLPLIAVAIYSVGMFLVRKYQTGESFDLNKLLQSLGLGAVATAALYLANGTIPGVDLVISQMETYAQSNTTLAAVGALVWGLFDQYILRGKLTGVPIISSVTGVSSMAPVEVTTAEETLTGTNTGDQPAASVSILGIYGGTSLGGVPAVTFSCDVNMIPELFADMVGLVTGQGVYSVMIDGKLLKDCEQEVFKIREVGQKFPIPMWIPQKYRVVGDHILTIRVGNMEYETPGASNDKKSIFVIKNIQNYTVTFTGIKKGE